MLRRQTKAAQGTENEDKSAVISRVSPIRGQVIRSLEEVRRELCWCQGGKFQTEGTSMAKGGCLVGPRNSEDASVAGAGW